MTTNYKTEAVAQLAQQIKAAGFRVFLAKSNTYGFYTDAEGSRVVSFQYDLGGFKFSGNYKPVHSRDGKYVGTGWIMGEYGSVNPEGLQNLFNDTPPRWATKGLACNLTTLAQHLKTYQRSSEYVEFGVPSETLVHYGMTEKEAQAAAGSNGSFDGPRPLCGNGNFHAKVTREKADVTCPFCIAKNA
jgi:hypothetical protein